MSIVAPERSLEQRNLALVEANRIRSLRSQLKRDIKGYRKLALDVILEPPEYVETMKIVDLLLATPKYGRVKANKILAQCRISPTKTVGGLSARQREEVAYVVRRRG